jgi:TRAP-type C4-dicarboxylate transport system permease small subunit
VNEILQWIGTLGWPQFICGVALVLTLLGFALIFGRRQLRTLRTIPTLPVEERRPARWQATRRLFGCILLLALASLLSVTLFFYEIPAHELAEERTAARAAGVDHVLSADQRRFVTWYASIWLTILTLLVLMVLLTAWEVYLVRRRAVQAKRRLLAEHKALLDHEAAARRQRHRG